MMICCESIIQNPKPLRNYLLKIKRHYITPPLVPFEVYRLELVIADNYGKVKYDNRRYSSSPAFAGRQLWVKAGAFEVDDKYREIVSHHRLYGRQGESMLWAPYLELMARRREGNEIYRLF